MFKNSIKSIYYYIIFKPDNFCLHGTTDPMLIPPTHTSIILGRKEIGQHSWFIYLFIYLFLLHSRMYFKYIIYLINFNEKKKKNRVKLSFRENLWP